MYRYQNGRVVGMGISLRPPAWLRNLIGQGGRIVDATAPPPTSQPATFQESAGSMFAGSTSWLLPVALLGGAALFLARRRGK